MILPVSSHKIILSASPSRAIPKCALYFLTARLILYGYVEPQRSLIFSPFGLTPIDITFAPNDFKSTGPALYPAPFAQSKTIRIPFRLKLLGRLLFKILI